MKVWDCREYKDAKAALDKIADDYQDKNPDLVDFISEHTWETLGVYHAAPVEHHVRLRTSNMLEQINRG